MVRRTSVIHSSTNPPNAVLSGPVYQTFATAGGTETISIDLIKPFPVISGMVCAFDIEVGDFYHYVGESSSDYAGGVYYFAGGNIFSDIDNRDLDFQIHIQPNPIPALGDWGIILLSMTLLIIGIVTCRKETRSIIFA